MGCVRYMGTSLMWLHVKDGCSPQFESSMLTKILLTLATLTTLQALEKRCVTSTKQKNLELFKRQA